MIQNHTINKNVSSILKNLKCYLPSFISGLLLILCFPKFNLYIIAWFALVPFLVSLYKKEPFEAFLYGLVLGIPYFLGSLYWIYHSINHYGNLSFSISLTIVVLLCLYLSLYTGLFALLFSITIKNTKLPSLFLAPIYWVLFEYIRSYLFTGFPWSSIGYTQYKLLSLIQIADITGIYGISFLILAINGAIADIFITRMRIKDMPLFPLSQTFIGLSFLIFIIIISMSYSQFRLRQNENDNNIKVSIIQGNIEQDKKWEPLYQKYVIDIYKDLTLKASLSSPKLIVWPETALPFIFSHNKEYTEEIINFQKSLDSYLLFGSILLKDKVKDENKNILTNGAVLLDKSGKISFIYDKIHLVPFGEYVPLQKVLFFVDKLVVNIGDYSKGKEYKIAVTPFGSFATLICYEIIFPGLVRKFFKNGGDFIVNITNDAWFGKTAGPYQHFSMAVFRAIENRKPVIRSANTGISGYIDSKGRIISETKLFQRSILTVDLKTNPSKSFYTKYGDLFSYICIVISIIILSNVFSKTRKKIWR